LDHFLRREYGTFKLATGDSNIMNVFNNLKYYAIDMWYQFLYLGLGLVAYGLFLFWKKDRKLDKIGTALLATFVFYTLSFHLLANLDLSNRLFYDVQSRFWLAPNMILCLFFVYGLNSAFSKWPHWKTRGFAAVMVLATALQVGLHYRMEDYSKNTMFYDLGKSLLDGVPKGSLIFMRGDVYVNAIRYMQTVENYRTDVMSIPFDLLWWPWMKPIIQEHFPNIAFPGKVYRYRRSSLGEFTLVDFFEANQGKFPMYIGKLADYETQNITQKFQLLPIGFLNKILPKNAPFDFETYKKDIEAFTYVPPGKEEIRDKSWEAFIYYNYWDRELEKSKIIFENAAKSGGNKEMLNYGAKMLEALIEKNPEAPPGAYRNLGVAYQLLSKTNPLYLPKMVEAWKKYLSFDPKDDPQSQQIRQILDQVQGVTFKPSGK